MSKSSLLNSTLGSFDSLKLRNPAFTGAFVEVTSLGGGVGSSYDDAEVRSLISQNAAAITLEQPHIGVGDLSISNTASLQSAKVQCTLAQA